MSETVLKIIPIDQDYVPSPAQQANALARLRELVPFAPLQAHAVRGTLLKNQRAGPPRIRNR